MVRDLWSIPYSVALKRTYPPSMGLSAIKAERSDSSAFDRGRDIIVKEPHCTFLEMK
jgi:hypothetical protein